VRTIGRWLKGWKMIPPLRRRPRQACVRLRPQLTVARRPNQVWTVDFKGWFRTGNGQRCEPLTVRDLFSRYGLAARVLPSPHVAPAQVVFRGLFQQHGLPEVIRMDNGNPFGSTGPAGLSRLSVWWLRLGIRVEYIRPACPQDNGAHEQFHGVMKRETTEPAAATRRGQQHRTTVWLEHYNRQRPHEGLAQAEPVTKYRKSRRKFPRHLPEIKYGPNHAPRRVRSNGQIRWAGRKRFVGEAFVGQIVGVRVLRKGVVAVYFSKHLLGHLHERDQGPMRPAHYRHRRPKRKKSKVLPMSWPRAHPSLLPSEEGEIAGRFDGGNHGTGDVIRPESQIHQVHGKRGSEPDWLSTSIREWARWPGTDKRSPHFILI
jgi:transposase InsO family protein